MSGQSISRTHDGIPIYDGSPELLPLFREEALQYLMTYEHKKRYLVGPRLAKELQGTAKLAIRNMVTRDPQWLSHPRGVYTLLQHLEDVIAKPSLPEASRFVMKFFYNFQRRRCESMTSWIARHAEALWEASQALRKVEKEFGGKKHSPGQHTQRRMSWSSTVGTGETHGYQGPRTNTDPFDEHGRLIQDDDDDDDEAERDSRHDDWGWYEGWETWSRNSGWSGHSWKTPEYEPPASWDVSSDIFIPEFLAGFLLLHRANLDTHERSQVMAAIRGEFSTASVGKALRELWSDDDLARRDRSKMSSALMVEEEGEEELEALHADLEDPEIQLLDEESREAYFVEQDKAEEALEAMRTQKATLKEARWKQKQIKLGRGYFPPKPFAPRPTSQNTSQARGDLKCFRCGGPHLARNCPNPSKEARVAEQEAHFAFSAEEDILFGEKVRAQGNPILGGEYAGHVGDPAMTPQEMILKCQGIIDSGATSSLGSIEALEAVMNANLREHGDSQITIDTRERPTFRFGNGQTRECVSTAHVGISAGDQKGEMTVHVHDAPNQPVLVSRKALARLGAVIDFGEKVAIYKKVDATRVVPLREAQNGHLLMPLTGDILSGGHKRDTVFVSLSAE